MRWLVPFLLAAFVLAGCGQNGDSDDAPAEPPRGLTSEVPAAVTEACSRAESKARSPAEVICPPIVPIGRTTIELAGQYGRRSYVASFHTASIEPQPHWLISGGPTAEMEKALSSDGEPRFISEENIAGTSVQVREQDAYNINQGHVILTWEEDGLTYLVSVHGFDNLSLARGIAEGLLASS